MAFTGYSVNDTAFHIALSQYIIADIVQNDLYQDGLGLISITADSAGAAAVRVPKIQKSTGEFRKLGASTNGGFKNTSTSQTKGLDEEIVDLLFLYDQMEDVPNVQNILSIKGAASVERRASEIAKAITRGRNSGTMAYQIGAVISAAVADTATDGSDRVYQYTAGTTGSALSKLIAANAALDDGDSYHDTFPRYGRALICRSEFISELRQNGNIIVGGSNFAQEIIASGAIDPSIAIGDLPENVTGYRGMVDGVPAFLATTPLWTKAESWLGLTAGDLDFVTGILASHLSTGRGQAFPEQVKVIDSPDVNGLRIQPLSNFGAKVFFDDGIRLLTKTAKVFGDGGDFTTALTVIPPGSRA